jgi:hypothetical protein
MIISIAAWAKAQTTYPVVWTEMTSNLTVNADNSLMKTGTPGVWDGAAVTQNVLGANTDGFVQFTYAAGSVYMVSLSRFNLDTNYGSNDYQVYIDGVTNIIGMFKGPTSTIGLGSIAAGDVIKFARTGTNLFLYKNGTQLFTTPLSVTSGLSVTDVDRVDVSIQTGTIPPLMTSFQPAIMVQSQFQYTGATGNTGSITVQTTGQYDPATYSWSSGETTSSISGKAQGAYTVTISDAQSRTVSRTYGLGYPISWVKLRNVTVNSDNTLTKTDAAGWTAGASSSNILTPNVNGWLEFVVNETGRQFAIGLSYADTDAGIGTIDYCFYIQPNGAVSIVKRGGTAAGFSLMKGDVFRVSREGTTVKFYVNGAVKYTTATDATTAAARFVVDVAMASTSGGALPQVTCSFDKQINTVAAVTLPVSNNTGGALAVEVSGTYEPSTITWSSGETTANLSNKPRGLYTITVADAASRTLSKTYRLGYPLAWTDLQNVTANADNSLSKANGSLAWDGAALSTNTLAPLTDGWIQFQIPLEAVWSRYMVGLSRLNNVATYASIDYAFYYINGFLNIYEGGSPAQALSSYAEGDILTIAREGTNIKYYINNVVVRTKATTASYELYGDVSLSSGTLPPLSASFSKTAGTYYAIADGAWTNPACWSTTEGGAAATGYPGGGDTAKIKGRVITISSGLHCAGVEITTINDATALNIDGSLASLTVRGSVKVKGENNAEVARALTVTNGATISVSNP